MIRDYVTWEKCNGSAFVVGIQMGPYPIMDAHDYGASYSQFSCHRFRDTLLDNDSGSGKRSAASTPAAVNVALDGDSHNIYPPGREVNFVCKCSHLLFIALSHFFLLNRWVGHDWNRYLPSLLLDIHIADSYDQKRSSRNYSISMRSRNTSSLAGEKYNHVGYVISRPESSIALSLRQLD